MNWAETDEYLLCAAVNNEYYNGVCMCKYMDTDIC